MDERNPQAVCLESQTSRGEASHGPADEYETVGIRVSFQRVIRRRQQILSSAVDGVRVPIGHYDANAATSQQLGERPDRGAGIGLHAVPHQRRGSGGLAEEIGQPTRRVLDSLHDFSVPAGRHAPRLRAMPYAESDDSPKPQEGYLTSEGRDRTVEDDEQVDTKLERAAGPC
jgi:hypothetical protein